jgi:sigma-B regulation protein RsbU (phosphoserine phosphatase)
LTVAAGVAIFRPTLLAARLLLLASAAVGFAAISLAWQSVTTDAGSSAYMWLLRVYVFALVLGPAALVHLFLVFPRRSPVLVRLDSLGPPKLRIGTFVPLLMLYCLPIAIALILLEAAEPLGVLRGGVLQHAEISLPQPLPGQRNWVAAIVLLVAAMLLGAVVALSQTYLGPPSPGARVQMRWMLGALVVLFVSELWGRGVYVIQGYLTHQAVGLPPPPLPEALAWMALPVAVGVAVVRHQLFDIRLVVRATVLYAPLTILLVGAYLGLVFVLSRTAVAILGPDSASDPTVSVLAALGVAGLAYPLRQRLQGLLERTFYRDQLARRRFLEAANDALGRAQPPDVVAEFLTTRTVELLGLSGAWFVTPARPGLAEGRAVIHYPPGGLSEGVTDVAGAVLLARDEGRLDPDSPDSPDADVLPVDGALLESWYAMGARLAVPLRVAEPYAGVLGVWLLGARRSGTAFDREDLRGCTRVGHQAAVLLENAQFQEEQVQQIVMRRELDRAREIQQRLLPQTLRGWPGLLEIAARFRPARETSGDFYDLLPLGAASDSEEERLVPLLLAVGDVAGKGIAAALVTALARTALRAAAEPAHVKGGSPALAEAGGGGGKFHVLRHRDRQMEISPAAILERAGTQLHRDLGARDFVACALVVLEPPSSSQSPCLRLGNAGQVPPLLCRGGRASELVPEGERLPLGVLPNPNYHELELELEPGDVVVLSSDGLPETPHRSVGPDASNEFFGFERLAASATAWAAKADDAEGVADGIWADVTEWGGEDAHHDDMTLLVVRVLRA